jgi:hypothetical protein
VWFSFSFLLSLSSLYFSLFVSKHKKTHSSPQPKQTQPTSHTHTRLISWPWSCVSLFFFLFEMKKNFQITQKRK